MASAVGKQLGGKLGRVANEVQRAQRTAVTAASMALKRGVESEIRAVVPSGRLRNVGRGAKVGVRFDVKGTNNPTSLVRATGPLHLVERSTKAHTIGPRARRARSGRSAIRLPDGGFRRAVRHPGTRGREPFAKGIRKASPEAERALRGSMVDAVTRGLRGR